MEGNKINQSIINKVMKVRIMILIKIIRKMKMMIIMNIIIIIMTSWGWSCAKLRFS